MKEASVPDNSWEDEIVAPHSEDELATSVSQQFFSLPASSRNSPFTGGSEASYKTGIQDEEDELNSAAVEGLATHESSKNDIFDHFYDKERAENNNFDPLEYRKHIIQSMLKVIEEDHESFLLRIRERINRVRIKSSKIEVRYMNITIEGDVFIGSRALPTLLNATLNAIEGFLQVIRVVSSNKKVIRILQDVSGIIKPSRMTLLLGPPGSGKTTFLKTLAGVLEKDLRVTGEVTYCGHKMSDFIPQRTCAYVRQHDVHHGEMTVRETFEFAQRCLGVGSRYDLLVELLRRESVAGITPDPEIDAFMKATAMAAQDSSLITDYVLKIQMASSRNGSPQVQKYSTTADDPQLQNESTTNLNTDEGQQSMT